MRYVQIKSGYHTILNCLTGRGSATHSLAQSRFPALEICSQRNVFPVLTLGDWCPDRFSFICREMNEDRQCATLPVELGFEEKPKSASDSQIFEERYQ